MKDRILNFVLLLAILLALPAFGQWDANKNFPVAPPINAKTRILVASTFGAKLDWKSYTDQGHDDTAVIQSLLDKAKTDSGGVEVVIDGNALITRRLIIHSNTKLTATPGGGLHLASHSNQPLLSDDLNGNDYNANSNIIVENILLDGNGYNQTMWPAAGHPYYFPSQVVPVGWGSTPITGYNIAVWFSGINGLTLRNVEYRNPPMWGICIGGHAENVLIENCKVYLTGGFIPYVDGVHILGESHDILVRHCWFNGSDDCTDVSDDELTGFPYPYTIYRGTNQMNCWNIGFEDIQVGPQNGDSSQSNCRGFRFYNTLESGVATNKNIWFKNWYGAPTSAGSAFFTAAIPDSHVFYVDGLDIDGFNLTTPVPNNKFDLTCLNLKNCTIKNCVINGPADNTYAPLEHLPASWLVFWPTVDNLTLANNTFRDFSTNTAVEMLINKGNITNLVMVGNTIYGSNVSNLLYNTTGSTVQKLLVDQNNLPTGALTVGGSGTVTSMGLWSSAIAAGDGSQPIYPLVVRTAKDHNLQVRDDVGKGVLINAANDANNAAVPLMIQAATVKLPFYTGVNTVQSHYEFEVKANGVANQNLAITSSAGSLTHSNAITIAAFSDDGSLLEPLEVDASSFYAPNGFASLRSSAYPASYFPSNGIGFWISNTTVYASICTNGVVWNKPY